MQPAESIKKIRNYALVSFILPLIAINSCLFMYKFIGNLNINKYANFEYSDQRLSKTYKVKEYYKIESDTESYSFTNCPKYKKFHLWNILNGQSVSDLQNNLPNEDFEKINNQISNLQINNQIVSVTIKYTKNLNNKCIKNHHFLYSLFSKFRFIEKIVLAGLKDNAAGFSKVNNPYFYGEVSISRTARYFPATLIFKTFIILSSIFLLFYWKNNLHLFNNLKNKNKLNQFSRTFFYTGVLSAFFLFLHAIFLGSDFGAEWFVKVRRLILTLFVVFEITSQIFLTRSIFKFKKELKNYINIPVLIMKVIFVILIFFLTIYTFATLSIKDPGPSFKNILEWNYFSFLLLYYFLSRFLWKLSP